MGTALPRYKLLCQTFRFSFTTDRRVCTGATRKHSPRGQPIHRPLLQGPSQRGPSPINSLPAPFSWRRTLSDGFCSKHCSRSKGPTSDGGGKGPALAVLSSSRAGPSLLTDSCDGKIKQGRGDRKGGHQGKHVAREFLKSTVA